MLDVGHFRASTCSGISRRAFVQLGASLPLALGAVNGGNVAWASAKAKAKSVIFVWLWGAPSHLDTLDPKPDAPSDIRGPFSTIETRTPGLRYSELLPKLAACSDLYTVIRSHVTSAPGHPDAGTVGLTGFAENPAPAHPNFGSIVGKHRGSSGSLPPFVMLGRGIPRDVVRIVDGWGGGRLGGSNDPFMISCSSEGRAEIPSLKLLDDLSPTRLDDRRKLLQTLELAERQLDVTQNRAAVNNREWGNHFRRAYDLLTQPEARDAFDLSRESPATREAYGFTAFGQSCLLARRLAEARVPYIHVNWSEYVECMTPNTDFGWDTHIYNFELLPDRHCPIFDRAFSTLLHDLKQRGLLDSTLVVAMGEFGRTPKINSRAARDHWPNCYSSIWAGAGLAGGRVIGASDKQARDPITAPITPLAVGASIAELAGLDTQARAEMSVLPGGVMIHELV